MNTSRWTFAGLLLAAALLSVTAAVADGRGSSGGLGTAPPPGGDGGKGGKTTNNRGTFPVRAPHSYGDGLGAGRGHQGQDLLARCGKPVVAAEPGRVRFKKYQASGAGNYVVVKGRDYDYVYMHLLRPAKVNRGERLVAGQRIGRVGSTGRSSACHLHFEMWSKPGWYRGGSPVSPTPFLKRWDQRR